MTAGKISAQTGHAYESALFSALDTHPERVLGYKYCKGGSKVSLKAKNNTQLVRLYNEALALGLPCSVVVDQNHIIPDNPSFNGSCVLTAVAIGPVRKSETKHLLKKLNCIN